MSTRLLKNIQSNIQIFSTSERRVAQLCLSEPLAFYSLSTADIGNLVHVSKPTVVRFCQKLGFDGIADFKSELRSAGGHGIPYIHYGITAHSNTTKTALEIMDAAVSSLRELRQNSSENQYERCVDALIKTHERRGKIQFHGLGASAFVAEDASLKFSRVGANSQFFGDSHLQVFGASQLTDIDCAIFISNSGKSIDLIDTCDYAQRQGATTIAITPTDSNLSCCADIVVTNDHHEKFESFCPMNSRILQLTIIDILISAFSLRIDFTPIQRSLRSMEDELKRRKRF